MAWSGVRAWSGHTLAVSTVIIDHSAALLQRIATKVAVRQRIVNYGGCKLRQAFELKLSR
jgi:hypothetical protein